MPCITIRFDPAIGPVLNVGFAEPATVGTGSTHAPLQAFPALVDTGADVTCISPLIAREVGLPLLGKRLMSTAAVDVEVNTFLADVALPFGAPPQTEAMAVVRSSMIVMEFQPREGNYQALLGRDIINSALFTMTGYDERFTICM